MGYAEQESAHEKEYERHRKEVEALRSELAIARKCLEEIRNGYVCVAHYVICRDAFKDYDAAIKKLHTTEVRL